MSERSKKLPSTPKKSRLSQQDKKHLDELLDEALDETFPASDALAMLELASEQLPEKDGRKRYKSPVRSGRAKHSMEISRKAAAAAPVWLVKATWIEDEAEASEQWEVNADTAHQALAQVTTHFCFHPHHVEVRLRLPEGEEKARTNDLPPGKARRVPSQ